MNRFDGLICMDNEELENCGKSYGNAIANGNYGMLRMLNDWLYEDSFNKYLLLKKMELLGRDVKREIERSLKNLWEIQDQGIRLIDYDKDERGEL